METPESFYKHCKERFTDGEAVFSMFMAVFSFLSIACILDDKILCVHGGIPRVFMANPHVDIMFHLKYMEKPICGDDAPHECCDIVFDLLWSDPVNEERCRRVPDLPEGFRNNPRNGDGPVIVCAFEMPTLDAFLKRYKLELLVRAHECMEPGCYVRNSCKMITVFSSSGYNGRNTAGALVYYGGTVRILKMIQDKNSGRPLSYK